MKGQSFNPLFIGACPRTIHRRPIPRTHPRRFNPLFIGACPRTFTCTKTGNTVRCGFNPLFIGACPRTRVPVQRRPVPRRPFQSPLHRGMSADASHVPVRWEDGSFNPLFIGACPRTQVAAADGRQRGSFNPLFIGACPRTRPLGAVVLALGRLVSIPSSSGHVRGQSAGFPLFVTDPEVSIPSSSGHVRGQEIRFFPPSPIESRFNPLFIGACPRTRGRKGGA